MALQHAIGLVPFGDLADPRMVVTLAQAAERAGWDGLFVWDHLAFAWGVPSGDPWVLLSAVAQATDRICLGTNVTPLPRRRPQVIANTLATLDLLSHGRTILGVGLGGMEVEYAAFGEETDAKVRAAKVDESLQIIDALWRGRTVNFAGDHYTVDSVTLAPLPMQQPRIPIWIGGESLPALRRAAQWDGWVIGGCDEHGAMTRSPGQLADQVAAIRGFRDSDGPFAVAMDGYSTASDGARVQDYADAGLTWWLESLHGFRGDPAALLARIHDGPPA